MDKGQVLESVLQVSQEQRDFFLLRRDIPESIKCKRASFAGPPECAGDGCVPCYIAHLMKLFPKEVVTARSEKLDSCIVPFQACNRSSAPIVGSLCLATTSGVKKRGARWGGVGSSCGFFVGLGTGGNVEVCRSRYGVSAIAGGGGLGFQLPIWSVCFVCSFVQWPLFGYVWLIQRRKESLV